MKGDYKFLSIGVVVFKVLAWVSLVIQVLLGIILLVTGGAAIPVGGLEVPARVIGLLNCVAAVIYFFILSLIANVIKLLLDLKAQVNQLSTPKA